MPFVPIFSFSSPIFGAAAFLLALAAVGIVLLRHIPLPRISAILFSLGLLFFATAAAHPIWHHTKHGSIAVMVDLSPSTRGAKFRNPADLQQRLAELIGSTRHQLIGFASQTKPLDPDGPFDEMPADQTTLNPPDADAIVLFTDARFTPPPNSPPIYVIADPGLENITDASVQKLELRDQSLTATIANTATTRQAEFPDGFAPIATGTFIITRPAPAQKSPATVKLNPSDLWPENDSLSIRIQPPPSTEKWWIGPSAPPGDWRKLSPQQFPTDAEAFLSPSVIVIDNQPSDAFSPSQLDRLTQYTRDLGGSIVLLGGDHAFGAGAYGGTPLDQISPLASFPPTPTRRWILLADASGSMAQPTTAGPTRWQIAADAITRLIPSLPPADPVQIGQFSDTVNWWLDAPSAAEATKATLPPGDAQAHGPTNLEAALQKIADDTNTVSPSELLVLSDCDADINYPDALASRLQEKGIHLYVLAIAHGKALDIIRKIATTTGGQVIEQFDPAKWVDSIRKLSQTALPPTVVHHTVGMLFLDALKSLPAQTVSTWNRIWTKPSVDLWASTLSEPTDPAGAFWHVGSGSVLAFAFEPDPLDMDFIASSVATQPHDPRFTITWRHWPDEHVTVDAADNGQFLNRLQIQLNFPETPAAHPIPLTQTAPGRYEANAGWSPDSRIAMLQTPTQVIDRISLPARYPPEFNALGNDHDAMRQLANSTGGETIIPTDHAPIDFHWPTIATPLSPSLCFIAVVSIGTALVFWKLRAHQLLPLTNRV